MYETRYVWLGAGFMSMKWIPPTTNVELIHSTYPVCIPMLTRDCCETDSVALERRVTVRFIVIGTRS